MVRPLVELGTHEALAINRSSDTTALRVKGGATVLPQ